jgi:hypothetical protein
MFFDPKIKNLIILLKIKTFNFYLELKITSLFY